MNEDIMSVPLSWVIFILIGHWVGDYLFQTNKIADRKRVSLVWLTIHVLVYTATVGIVGLFLFPWARLPEFLLLNGALHFVVDFFTGRLTARYKLNQRVFYLIIGFDQLIHTSTLVATMFFYFGVL